MSLKFNHSRNVDYCQYSPIEFLKYGLYFSYYLNIPHPVIHHLPVPRQVAIGTSGLPGCSSGVYAVSWIRSGTEMGPFVGNILRLDSINYCCQNENVWEVRQCDMFLYLFIIKLVLLTDNNAVYFNTHISSRHLVPSHFGFAVVLQVEVKLTYFSIWLFIRLRALSVGGYPTVLLLCGRITLSVNLSDIDPKEFKGTIRLFISKFQLYKKHQDLLFFNAYVTQPFLISNFHTELLCSEKYKSWVHLLVWAKKHSDSKSKYTKEDIVKMLEFPVSNIFAVVSNR